MGNETGDVIVVFNGEIYNYRELRQKLTTKGHLFRSRTDTETLVHLYEEEGESIVTKLDGDYAFAIWDARNKRMLLARDPAGVKPLYYMQTKGWFLFASEINALLHSGLATPEIDEEAVYHYLTYLVAPPPKTLVRSILKLPIGSALSVNQETGEVSFWRYWEPLPGLMETDANNLDEEFEDLFNQSVRKRLLADVPVGVLFSGGVDSTLNALSFQREITPAKVRTYSVGFSDAMDYDESETAREMASLLGTEHYETKINVKDAMAGSSNLVRFQDEPISDPVSIPLYFVTKLARETGTIVLHAGEGADEIFCGYPKWSRLIRDNRLLWKPVSCLPPMVGRLLYWGLKLFPRDAMVAKIADALRRRGLNQEFFISSAVAYYESEKQSVLSQDFKNRMSGVDSFEVVRPLYERIRSALPTATFLQCITFIELNLRLPELLLMRADKMSMANSVELRVPFLDRRLIEFALSVPESFKLRNAIPKEPVKRLASRTVSAEKIYKPKRGFGVPIREWFQGELKIRFKEMLDDRRTEADAFFNLPAVISRLDHGPKTTREAFQLWVIYNFLNWRRELVSRVNPLFD